MIDWHDKLHFVGIYLLLQLFIMNFPSSLVFLISKAVSPLWVTGKSGSRDCPLGQTVTALPPLNTSSFMLWVSGMSSPDLTVMITSESCGTESQRVLDFLQLEYN